MKNKYDTIREYICHTKPKRTYTNPNIIQTQKNIHKQKVGPNNNQGCGVITMYQSRFANFNKSTTPVYDAFNRGGYACVVIEGYKENLCTFLSILLWT